MNVLGIQVRYDPKSRAISDSRGLLRWKEIVVGPALYINFSPREKQAIILHEVGHCKLFHLERRILRLWMLLWPPALKRYCEAQEFQADLFAANCGYSKDLADALARVDCAASLLHPNRNERIERLRAWPSKA